MSDNGASDSKSHHSDEGNDDDFSVNAFLSPLGGGRDDNFCDDNNDVHSNLTRSSRASSFGSTIRNDLITFTLTFESAKIPFEFALNSEVGEV